MPPLFTVPPASAVQRKISQDKSSGRWVSDLDPSVDFGTYQEALDFEVEMEAPPPISGGRPPTLYTYLKTKSWCKISSRGIPQGPHTVGYSAITNALFKAKIKLTSLIAEQVPPPEKWVESVRSEFRNPKILDGKTELSQRLLRAYRAYNGLWQELQRVVAGKSLENPIDLIHELMNLGPFAVYGYVNPDKVKKKHLKGKGEDSDLSNPKNIDRLAKFKQKAKYQESIDDRLLLLDDDYEPDESDEDLSDDEMGDLVEERSVIVKGSQMVYMPDEVPSDGNCFFNALRALGSTQSVAELRQIAYQNGGQNGIQTDRAWADESDIRAVANHLKIRIAVIVIGLDGSITQAKLYGNGGKIFFMAHIFGGHFTPLRE